MGILAVTRSFGDHSLKKFVIARPYTTVTELDSTSTFMIVACDGLWDVLSDDEAADLVNKVIAEKGMDEFDSSAEVLLKAAIDKGSTDNITIQVVLL